jgi:hypothetical protein
MLHYAIEKWRNTSNYREARGAVCGDQKASAATITLSDVCSIVDCPACRDEIRKLHAADPETLAMIENCWSPNPVKPVWSEKRKRWVLPKL